LLVLLTLLACGEGRADEWFLKIDGVPGELTEGQFAGWTPVHSVGALARVAVNPTNSTPGPAAFSCEIQKAFDRTSPAILQHCGRGDRFRRVTLAHVLTQPRATQYRITLDGVLVSAVNQGGAGNSPETMAKETVVLTFDKIEVANFDLDANGGTTGGLTALFDLATAQGSLKTRPPFRATVVQQAGRAGVSVTWPAENGHRYQLLAKATLEEPWKKLLEVTAAEDGPRTQFVPIQVPVLFLRVEEVE
jgi:type VI protein secretion system component Hcp